MKQSFLNKVTAIVITAALFVGIYAPALGVIIPSLNRTVDAAVTIADGSGYTASHGSSSSSREWYEVTGSVSAIGNLTANWLNVTSGTSRYSVGGAWGMCVRAQSAGPTGQTGSIIPIHASNYSGNIAYGSYSWNKWKVMCAAARLAENPSLASGGVYVVLHDAATRIYTNGAQSYTWNVEGSEAAMADIRQRAAQFIAQTPNYDTLYIFVPDGGPGYQSLVLTNAIPQHEDTASAYADAYTVLDLNKVISNQAGKSAAVLVGCDASASNNDLIAFGNKADYLRNVMTYMYKHNTTNNHDVGGQSDNLRSLLETVGNYDLFLDRLASMLGAVNGNTNGANATKVQVQNIYRAIFNTDAAWNFGGYEAYLSGDNTTQNIRWWVAQFVSAKGTITQANWVIPSGFGLYFTNTSGHFENRVVQYDRRDWAGSTTGREVVSHSWRYYEVAGGYIGSGASATLADRDTEIYGLLTTRILDASAADNGNGTYRFTTGGIASSGTFNTNQVLYLPNTTGFVDGNFVNTTTSARGRHLNISFSVPKVDDQGNAVRNVQFTVYSNAACTSAVGTITTNNSGVATFSQNNILGIVHEGDSDQFTAHTKTYWIRETSVNNAQVNVNNSWQNATLQMSTQTYRVEYTWYPYLTGSTDVEYTRIVVNGYDQASGGVAIVRQNNRVHVDNSAEDAEITAPAISFTDDPFVNIGSSSLGINLDIYKVAQLNGTTQRYPARGATFTVYSNAACTNVVGTMSYNSNNPGHYTYNLGQIGPYPRTNQTYTSTYYVKETSAATSYYYNNSWRNQSFELNSTVYKVVYTWNPGTGAASYTVTNNATGASISSGSAQRTSAYASTSITASATEPNVAVLPCTATLNIEKVAQIDNTNQRYPARGATFTVYSNAACTNTVGTMTDSGNNGNYSFSFSNSTTGWFGYRRADLNQNLSVTYYFKETSPASSYNYSNAWRTATFEADATVYKLVYTWNPSTGSMSYTITNMSNNTTVGSGNSTRSDITASSSIRASSTISNVVDVSATATISVIKVNASDGQSYPARNATFSIYRTQADAQNNRNVIGTITDPNHNGNYSTITFNNNTAGWFGLKPITDSNTYNLTYYVRETTAPNGFYANNQWVSATFVPDNTVYTLTYAWTPASSRLVIGGTFGATGNGTRVLSSTVTSVDSDPTRPNYAEVTASGSFTLNKIDEAGRTASGATFTVYSDENCTNRIGTMTEGTANGHGNGVYTYTNIQFPATDVRSTTAQTLTYYVRETSPASSVYFNGAWCNVDCIPSGDTYKISYVWVPSRYGADQEALVVTVTNMTTNEQLSRVVAHRTAGALSVSVSATPFSVVNETRYSVNASKTVPTGNNFDASTVVFSLYVDTNGNGRYDNGETLIARSSSVSTSGVVTWDTTNGLVDPSVRVNGHYQLVEGAYVLREEWVERIIIPLNPEGTEITVHSTNLSDGWTKINQYTYDYGFVLNPETTSVGSGDLGTQNVVNREDTNWYRAYKTVTVPNDVGTFTFELWQGDNLLAIGTATSTGTVGTRYPIIWDTENLAEGIEIRNDNKDILLPVGDYQLREIIPTDHYYGDTEIPYTYGTPDGWSVGSIAPDGWTVEAGESYWYQDFTVAASDTEVTAGYSSVCANTRQEGTILISKIADNNVYDLTFDIYYHGNGATPDDDTRIYLDSLSLAETEDTQPPFGLGYNGLAHVPYGWYEIVENPDAPGLTQLIWVATSDGYDYDSGNSDMPSRMVCVRPDDDILEVNLISRYTGAINIHHPEITAFKLDSWTTADNEVGAVITSDYPEEWEGNVGGCEFRLYIDNNQNGILDPEEKYSFTVIRDADNDGIVSFSRLRLGVSYILVESATVDGYYLNTEPYAFTLTEAMVYQRDVENTPYTTTVQIYKVDEAFEGENETRQYLSGASFEIYTDVNNNTELDDEDVLACTMEDGAMRVATVTESVDENGNPIYISDPLHFGSYLLVETEAPEGYAMIEGSSVQAFRIDALDTTAEDFEVLPIDMAVQNTCRNYIDLYKVDLLIPENYLSNAVFEVYRDNNNNGLIDETDTLVGEMSEIEQGHYRIGNPEEILNGNYEAGLPFGTYLIRETQGPMWNGNRVFKVRDTIWSTTITEDITLRDGYVVADEGREDIWNDAFGSMTIEKYDEATGERLTGAEFTVYVDSDSNSGFDAEVDEVYAVVTDTDGDGIYTLEHMPRQGYFVVETAAPEYYEIDPNMYYFSISLDNLDVTVDNVSWDVVEGVQGEFLNHNPIVGTTLTDEWTLDHVGVSDVDISLVDRVEYNGLILGDTYVMEGTLYDLETGEAVVDEAGVPVTSSVTFVADGSREGDVVAADGLCVSGYIDVPFTFTLNNAARNLTWVAGEKVRHEQGDRYVGIHFDLSDAPQTVWYPDIHTTLIDVATEDHVAPQSGTVVLVDTVAYENLVPGLEYSMSGTLMNKDTHEVFTDASGNAITSSVVFTPATANGSVEITFTFDAALLDGATLVAFEELIHNGVTVCTHNDINDIDQTVNIPDIGTTFYDRNLAEAPDMATQNTEVELVDRVDYENIVPGLEYTLYGVVMVKETNEPLRDSEGNIVTASTTFVPTDSHGSVEVVFTVDTTACAGQTLVAFETLEYNGVTLVVHADIEDADQTVQVPDVHTTLTDTATDSHYGHIAEDVVLTDTVAYTNLVVGRTYTITGTLVNRETGVPVQRGNSGVGYVERVTFTPETPDGTVDVVFTINANDLRGVSVVAFETLYYDDIAVAVHADIEDQEQTVTFPTMGTTATVNGNKIFSPADVITLTDTVEYTGLIPGRTYRVYGYIMDQATSEPFSSDGHIVECSTTFIPETSDGTISMDFVFNGASLANEQKLVVFEEMYLVAQETDEVTATDTPELLIITHKDITDEGQTVTVSVPPKTGDTYDAELYELIAVIATVVLAICISAGIAVRKKKRK